MKFKLRTGTELDLPTADAVDEAIREFEAELKRLRRLKRVVDDLNGEGDEEEEVEETVK